jgi:tetratricopeptide (TPR) repeat protein
MKNIFSAGILLLVIGFLILTGSGCKTHKGTTDGSKTSTMSAQDYLKKGNAQLDLKNYKDALTLLNKAIELDAESGEAYAYRGMAKYHLKDYKGAIEDFDAALKIIPDYGEVYDLRGVAKAELGDKVGACEDWNKSFELGFNKAYDLIEKYCLDNTDQKK